MEEHTTYKTDRRCELTIIFTELVTCVCDKIIGCYGGNRGR